jgi:Poly(ADP-ribose) polymerase catalytic domain
MREMPSFVGTVYGHGVYFHAQAQYSHTYAKPNASGQRAMFLARVLIGKTSVGNSQMRVPPTGCDTTTDGGHIFVTYHDAAAYAEHLITFK